MPGHPYLSHGKVSHEAATHEITVTSRRSVFDITECVERRAGRMHLIRVLYKTRHGNARKLGADMTRYVDELVTPVSSRPSRSRRPQVPANQHLADSRMGVP